MLVLPQRALKVKWHNTNREWYESRGYIFTKYNDCFYVNVLDLTLTSKENIELICDYCNETHMRKYVNYIKGKEKNRIKKHFCNGCKGKFTTESNMIYSFDDMIVIFDEHDFIPLIKKEDYKTSSTPVPYQCKNCGHKSRVSLSNCILGKGCAKCKRNELTDKQRFDYGYVKSYFENEGCILLSTKYKNKDQLLDYICECGRKDKIRFGVFKKGQRCKKCGYKKLSDIMKTPIEEIRKIFEDQNCVLLSEEYIPKKKLKYICNCGNIDEKTLNKFKQGQRCHECGLQKLRENFQHDYKYVKSVFEEKGCTLLTKNYINMQQMLDYICKCGEQATSTLGNFIVISGCPNCSVKSKGEKRIKEMLLEMRIKFLPQYTFDDCKNEHKLLFDFAIFDENDSLQMLIEYDGEQHYKPVEIWGGQTHFEYIQRNDEIKNTYCNLNSIPLLRIPYWDYKNIEIILNNILKNKINNIMKEVDLTSFFYFLKKEEEYFDNPIY